MYVIKLSLQSLIKNKKRTFTVCSIISILILAIVGVNFFSVSSTLSEEHIRKLKHGGWHYAIYGNTFDDQYYLNDIGTMYKLDSPNNIASFDKSMMELSYFKFIKGRMPENNTEVILTIGEIENLSLGIDINQEIILDVMGENTSFTIVGIIENYDAMWMLGPNLDFELPGIVTTGFSSNQVSQFATSDYRNLTKKDYVINTLAFPELTDSNSDEYRFWFMQNKRNENVRAFLTDTLVLISLLSMFIIFRVETSYYRDKILFLRHLGITKIESVLYLLVHTLLYSIFATLVFFIGSFSLQSIFSLNVSMRYGIDKYLFYDSIKLFLSGLIIIHLTLNARSVWSPLVANKKIPTRRSIVFDRLTQGLLILSIFIISFSLILPSLLELNDRIYGSYRNMVEAHNQSFKYRLSVRNSTVIDFDGVSDPKMFITKPLWTLFMNHKDVETFDSELKVTFDYRFDWEQYQEGTFSRILIRYVDEEDIKQIKQSGVSITDSFREGNSLIYINHDYMPEEFNGLEVGANIIINEDRVFSIGALVENDEDSEFDSKDLISNKYGGMVASKAFFDSFGLDTDLRTSIELKLKQDANPYHFDSYISRNIGGHSVSNMHMEYDIILANTKNQLIYHLTQIGLFLVVYFSLNISVFLNELVSHKQEILLKRLIGFSNIEIMVHIVRKYLIIGLLSLVPALGIGLLQYVNTLHTEHVLIMLQINSSPKTYFDYLRQFLYLETTWTLISTVLVCLVVTITLLIIVISILLLFAFKSNPLDTSEY